VGDSCPKGRLTLNDEIALFTISAAGAGAGGARGAGSPETTGNEIIVAGIIAIAAIIIADS